MLSHDLYISTLYFTSMHHYKMANACAALWFLLLRLMNISWSSSAVGRGQILFSSGGGKHEAGPHPPPESGPAISTAAFFRDLSTGTQATKTKIWITQLKGDKAALICALGCIHRNAQSPGVKTQAWTWFNFHYNTMRHHAVRCCVGRSHVPVTGPPGISLFHKNMKQHTNTEPCIILM